MIEISKALRSWEEHEKAKREYYNKRYVESGIACPECGEELLVDKWVVLTSYPPQKQYHCAKCGWNGTA